MVDPERLRAYLESTPLTYKTRSISYIFDCPRCNKRDKLYIRRSDGRFCCWKCKSTSGFSGKPEYALAELLGTSVSEVQQKLYDMVSDEPILYLEFNFKDFFNPEDEEVWEEEPPIIQWPYDYYPINDKKAKRGLEYLESRGISLDIAIQYGIRYCPQRRRVAFPLELDGALVGYQERLVTPHKVFVEETAKVFETPKALTSEDAPKDRYLMFANRITSDYAVLCEGPVDAIKAHLCGGNVAALGKAVSKAHIQYLKNAGVKTLYIGLDGDALDETARIVRDEFTDMACKLLLAPKGRHDLGECSMEEVYEAFLNAPDVHRAFLFAFLR